MPRRPKAGTNAKPVRNEIYLNYPLDDGTVRRMVLRDTVVIYDPYLKLVRAYVHSVKTGNEFGSQITSRSVKDDLIKINIQI
jgi:hypothetical protein